MLEVSEFLVDEEMGPDVMGFKELNPSGVTQ